MLRQMLRQILKQILRQMLRQMLRLRMLTETGMRRLRPALRVMQMPVGTVAVFHDNDMTALVDADDKPLKFTTKEERQALAAKQDLEFKAQLAEAQKRAAAAAKNSKNAANAPAEAPADSEAEASESTEE